MKLSAPYILTLFLPLTPTPSSYESRDHVHSTPLARLTSVSFTAQTVPRPKTENTSICSLIYSLIMLADLSHSVGSSVQAMADCVGQPSALPTREQRALQLDREGKGSPRQASTGTVSDAKTEPLSHLLSALP